jgi:hypothetical protein
LREEPGEIPTAKRLWGGFLALAVWIAVMTLAAPRSVQALGATVVQVANATTNPAVAEDADRATRLPYQSHSAFDSSGPFLSGRSAAS